MNRLQSYYEDFKFPLKVLFFSSFLLTLGSVLGNPNLVSLFNMKNESIASIAELLSYTGGSILSYFPIYAFIILLQRHKKENSIVLVGIISYIVFTIVLTVLTPVNLGDSAYYNLSEIVLKGKNNGVYHLGAFGFIAVYFLVTQVYKRTEKSQRFNLISYIDQDSLRLVYSIVLSVMMAFLFSKIWPLFIELIYSFIKGIAGDVNNPMSMFAYGGFERVMALFNMDRLIHSELWFGSLGGSWVSLNGETFTGDVGIWTAQLLEKVNVIGSSDAGRYTSAYYVLNLFAVPAYIMAVFSTFTNKKFLRRNIIVLVLIILTSVLSGTLLPIELTMLMISPLLYIFHLFMVSFVFAVLSGFSVYLGFSYNGFINASSPGNIIDLVFYARNPALTNKVIILILVGIFVFILYFIMTRLYYSKLALDLLNISNKEEKIEDFISRLGGLENINEISNTPTRIHLDLEDHDKLNVEGLHRQGVTRIVETKDGFILSIGSSAYIYQKEVKEKLKHYHIEEEEDE